MPTLEIHSNARTICKVTAVLFVDQKSKESFIVSLKCCCDTHLIFFSIAIFSLHLLSLYSEVKTPVELLNIIILSHKVCSVQRHRGVASTSLLAISDTLSMFSLFVCLIQSLFNNMCVDIPFLGNSFLFSSNATVTAQNNDKCALLASALGV